MLQNLFFGAELAEAFAANNVKLRAFVNVVTFNFVEEGVFNFFATNCTFHGSRKHFDFKSFFMFEI